MFVVEECENWMVFECKTNELSLFNGKFPSIRDNYTLGKFRVAIRKDRFDQKELNRWLGFEWRQRKFHKPGTR